MMVAKRKAVSATPKRQDVARVVRKRRTGRQVVEVGMEGKVVALRAPEDVVISRLRASPREVSHFRGGALHVSDLLGKCMRKIALSEKLRKPMPTQPVSDSLALTFAQGVAIHDFVKAKLTEGSPTEVWGKWACLCGNTVTEPMCRSEVPQRVCPDCGTSPSRYEEVSIYDDGLGVSGSPDVLFRLDREGAFYITEVKSIAYEQWKEMARPLPDHVLQVVFYWLLMARAGYSLASQVSILYVSKGYVFKMPYKEFAIEIGCIEEAEDRLRTYLDDALSLKAFRDGGPLPDRTMCATKASGPAKECHVCLACFSMDG